MDSIPNRICVIGSSAAGKSTFSRALASKLIAEYIELDSHLHGPNWQPIPEELFIRSVRARMASNERWVIDGNYGNRARQFEDADLIIWLDYPFHTVISRVLRRTLRRLLTRESLWNGNQESWRMLFSRESIVLWVLQTYWKRRKELPVLLSMYPESKYLRFSHPQQATKWLTLLGQAIVVKQHFTSNKP